MKNTLKIFAFFVISQICIAQHIAVVDEDWETIAFGDTTGINQNITDGSYDAGLRLHNHMVGEVVTPHVNFTSASGNAFQLSTGTNPTGGFGILSATNAPRNVSLTVGSTVTLAFDMYVQAVPVTNNGVTIQMRLTGATDKSRTFTELTGASPGDVVSVSWEVVVDADMANATDINPYINFEGNQTNFSVEGPNSNGTELDVAQIDNLQMLVPDNPIVFYLDADGGSDSNNGRSPGTAWASLSHASGQNFSAGNQLLLQRGDTFLGKLEWIQESGATSNPIQIGAYDSGTTPVINAAGYLAGIRLQGCQFIEISDLEIMADGGVTVDGSNPALRYGVLVDTGSGQQTSDITLKNLYIHDIYPEIDTPHEGYTSTTYTGNAIRLAGRSGALATNIRVEDCYISSVGFRALDMSRLDETLILNNYMTDIGGPAMVPGNCEDLVVRGNTVNGSGQFSDSRMHGRGSGIWPFRCDRVLIERNAFMHANGRYDSCGVHIDIGCTDVVVQYNLSLDNEGGFVEILGENLNCAYRYNISINDGAREAGTQPNGLAKGDGHVILFSGHNGADREGPNNCYVYNNTIFVKEDQHCSFSIEETTSNVLVANNIFYIEGESEDGTPPWWGDEYPPGVENTIYWNSNLYQRVGVFPDDWIFFETNAHIGNPFFANPGGTSVTDYIPVNPTYGPPEGVAITNIPGDPIGLSIGLTVTEDFFGNPIVGLPSIGAVEVATTVPGAAFQEVPKQINRDSIKMVAVAGPVGTEYYFEETTGNPGGTDSGWQSSTTYTDTGLNETGTYAYTVKQRLALVEGGESAEVQVTMSMFLEIIHDDFSTFPNPDNLSSPFPVNTWHMDDSVTWSAESADASVTYSGGGIQLGWGGEEARVHYVSDLLWELNRDYELTGDWEIDTVFLENHLGFIAGIAEFDPTTGQFIQSIKEITVGELTSPVLGQTGSFTIPLNGVELNNAGVSSSNRIGVFFHHDDDGVLYSEGGTRNEIYILDNVILRYNGIATPVSLSEFKIE